MIIDKVAPFWTDTDREITASLTEEMTAISLEITQSDPTYEEYEEYANKLQDISKRKEAVRIDVEARYKKSFSRKPTALYEEVKDIVTHIEKEDFIRANEKIRESIAQIERNNPNAIEGDTRPLWEELKQATTENYANCYNYIFGVIYVQEDALRQYIKDQTKVEARLRKIVDTQVSKWYIKPDPAYLPMAHGKPFDAFAFMSSRQAEINRLGGATIERQGVKLFIEKFDSLKATLGVNTDKLLSTALTEFTKNNDFRNKSGEIDRLVAFPLKDYARKLGYDVDEHETNSPEEAEKEKKRAKNALDNARKAIKKDLTLLRASYLSWEEKGVGEGDFAQLNFFTWVGIKNGYIQMALSPEIAEYIRQRNVITQYPTALLKLDARKPNAYYIGRKLAEHYYIDNNMKRGTYNRIGVATLLGITDLPTYEAVQKKDPGHWEGRIKEPFENALDELTGAGVLTDWKYTHAKGIDLTEEEAYSIMDYDTFINLYIEYDLKDPEDQTDRIEEKDRRREEQRKRNGQKKRKKKANAEAAKN